MWNYLWIIFYEAFYSFISVAMRSEILMLVFSFSVSSFFISIANAYYWEIKQFPAFTAALPDFDSIVYMLSLVVVHWVN